jgi:hypothetical protein
MDTGEVIGTLSLAGEKIENGAAIDETGAVYLNSSRAMYRFDPDKNGVPAKTWREPYDRGHLKVLSEGSGSTPTLMGKDYVAIADNADPQVHVVEELGGAVLEQADVLRVRGTARQHESAGEAGEQAPHDAVL